MPYLGFYDTESTFNDEKSKLSKPWVAYAEDDDKVFFDCEGIDLDAILSGDTYINRQSTQIQAQAQTYSLTLTVTAGLGTITGAESGTYSAGTSFTLTAVDGAGGFQKWSDGVTDRTRTIVLNSDLTLGAEFKLNSNIDNPGELDYPTIDDLFD